MFFQPTDKDRVADHFDPIPAGWYQFRVENAEIKNRDGKESLSLKLKILGPSHGGRVIFANFNLKHPSEDAVRIARQQLAKLCEIAGKTALVSEKELIGVVAEAKVGVRPASGNYDASNDVKAYRKIEGAMPSAGAIASAAAAAPVGFSDDEDPF